MRNRSLIAICFAIGIAIWFFSGELTSNVVGADDQLNPGDVTATEIPHVRATRSVADMRSLYLEVSGQTRANRIVQVKAEVFGRVEQIPATRGTKVEEGDLLCQIAVDSRQNDFDKARADLKSAQLEYDGILDLRRQGLQSDITLAKANAALEATRAGAKHAQLALAKTMIVAPFAGVVEDQPVEIGDYLNIGQICVSVMEIDPILVVGEVAEKSISALQLGDLVDVTLITGQVMKGEVSFISRSPDTATRTYPVEITIHSPGENIRAGLSAEMKVPLGEQAAHLISSASLVLNDEGVMGVRTADDKNVVHFNSVKILSETAQGVWVSGLPDEVNLITVGHEEVFEGQTVKTDYTPLGSIDGS